ncbi:hypothetical protein ACEPPN_001425 [Leptodophora sp. 'Broadleaf-Isolate-01']
MESNSKISLVGLGNMGTALGHALLKDQKQLTIWNRTASRPSVTSLVDAGAVFEPDLSWTISNSPVTIICVLDYPTIRQILYPIVNSHALKSKTIINLTNGTPREAREMKEWMRHAIFDGGTIATPDMVATPASSIFISGENEQRFSSVTNIIEVWGRAQYVGQDPGAAALNDLALLAGMYGMFAGAITAMALLKKQKSGSREHSGVESQVTGMLNPWLQALLPYHAKMAESIDRGIFESLGNPIQMQSIGMQNILKACDEEGVDAGSLRYFAGLMEKVVAERSGEGGIAEVVTLLLK